MSVEVDETKLGAVIGPDKNGDEHMYYITGYTMEKTTTSVVIETILSKTSKDPEYEYDDKKFYRLTYGEFQRLLQASQHALMKIICNVNTKS